MKSTSRSSNIPIALLVRDTSKHIQSIQENKKIVDKVSAEQNGKEGAADYGFNMLIPRQDSYFPAIKYICSGELRPVPLVSVHLLP